MAETNARALAEITAELVKAQKEAMAALELPPDSPRLRLVLTLLVTCLDHGGAAAGMLSVDPTAYGVSAFALFRPTLETFARAVMFSLPNEVSDDEVTAFLDSDELPQRPHPKSGKRAPIYAGAIETIATEEVNRLTSRLGVGELGRLLDFQKSDLNGFVHGGKVLVKLYRSGNTGLQFNPSDETVRQVLVHIGRLTQLALSFAALKLAVGGRFDPRPLMKWWNEFCTHVARIDPTKFELPIAESRTSERG